MIFGFGGTIAGHLMRNVFGLYLIVALVVTAVQLNSEYQHVKETISKELKKFQTTYGPSISNLIWTFDRTGLRSSLIGMNENAEIVGVKVETEENVFNQSIGLTDLNTKEKSGFNDLFGHTFPAIYTDSQNRPHKMGTVTVYSSTSIVIDRVEHGFFLLVINAFLKTTALWLIAYYFIQKILARPLRNLTSQISTIRPDNLHEVQISGKSDNEFGFLVDAFNTMVKNQQRSNDELEQRVEDRTKELSESEEKFRDYAEISADRFWELDADLNVTFISPATEVLSTPPNEMLGQNFVQFVDNDLSTPEVARFRAHIKNQEPFRNLIFASTLTSTPEYIEISGRPFFDEQGMLVGYRGSTTDVSALYNAERELNHAQKMDSLGNLAGGVAHTLNNLLLPILSLSSFELKKTKDGSESQEILGKIVQASERAREEVARVLAFSRQDQNQKIPINIQSTITDSLELIRSGLPSTLELKSDLDPATGSVFADPTQMETVLLNLVTNSAAALEGQVGTIEIGLSRIEIETPKIGIERGSYARLSVADNGSGIDDATLPRIFDPYFTTKEVGDGTGLGLAMVHGIVQRHEGVINVSSTVNAGTEFEFFCQ